MSDLIRQALAYREELRAQFEDYRLARYEEAAEACRGSLLNARGKRAGIDSLSLFMGNAARANAYASEELREWWYYNGRPTFAEFERQNAPLYFGHP